MAKLLAVQKMMNEADVPEPADATFEVSCSPNTIAAWAFSGRLVSTVRLNYPWPIDGKEHPYETMLFDRDGHGDEVRHYMSHEAAVAGHKEMCEIHLQSQ